MKYIIKQPSPAFFEDWKNQCERCWDDVYDVVKNPMIRKRLRRSLLEEQGNICCYCQKSIDETCSAIEHIKCKDEYPEYELNYNNLLASCLGGQTERVGKSKRDKRTIPIYCDAIKDNNDIYVSPLDKDCESRFSYGPEGEIYCYDEDIDAKETIRILNLDCSTLRNLRKAAINVYKNEQNQFPDKADIPKIVEKLLQRNDDGRFDGFCVVVASFLKKFLP